MQRKSSSSVRIFYPAYNREEVISRLKAGVENLNRVLPLCRAVLFGSYEKKRYTVASDIDLLVVYKGAHREDAFSLVRRNIPLRGLEPHVYSEEEYFYSKENIEKMIARGTVIY